MNLLLSLLSSVLLRAPDSEQKARCTFKRLATFLVMGAYVLGCIGLYHYWVPTLGIAFSLFAVGGAILATSLLFLLIGWALKPKSTPLTKANTMMEKTLGQMTRSPLPIMAALAIGAAVFYLTSSRSKESRRHSEGD